MDTSDHRDMHNLGRVDLHNIWLAIRQIAFFAWLCLRERPQLVYALVNPGVAYLRDGAFIFLAKHLARAPVVIHLRGRRFREFYDESMLPLRWFINLTLRAADRVIVLAESLRSVFEPWFSSERIEVIPNGTPLNPDKASMDARHQRNGKFVVAYLGNLIAEKGFVDLLEAVPQVRRAIPQAEFRLAGDWWNYDDGWQQCKRVMASHDLKGSVIFVGVLTGPAKERFLLEADVLVFPTYYKNEGHPNVIIEGMAAGLPIVVTDYAAMSETVKHGVNGFLVPPKNPAAIAGRLSELAQAPELRHALGKASRELFEKHYTHEQNVAKLIACFKRCLGGRTCNQKASRFGPSTIPASAAAGETGLRSGAHELKFGPVRCYTASHDDLAQAISAWSRQKPRTGGAIGFLNPHVFNIAVRDPEICDFLNHCRWVSLDGIGVKLAASLLNRRMLPRVVMDPLVETVFTRWKVGGTALFLGLTEKNNVVAQQAALAKWPGIRVVASAHGFLSDDEYERLFKQHPDVDFVLIGMGTPRSERLLLRAAKHCPQAILWHIGGGTMRVLAGSKLRAPEWVSRAGCEWVHRIVFEPAARQRYLFGIPRYLVNLIRYCRPPNVTTDECTADQSAQSLLARR